MSEANHSNESWAPCEAGTLRDVAEAVRRRGAARERRRFTAGAAVVVCLLLVAVTVYSVTSMNNTQPRYGGITCSGVAKVMAAYIEGTLDADTTERVEQHLAECTLCREAHRKMTQGVAHTERRHGSTLVAQVP